MASNGDTDSWRAALRKSPVSDNKKHAGSLLIGAAALVTALATCQSQPDEREATERQRLSFEALSTQMAGLAATVKQLEENQGRLREWNANLRGYLNGIQQHDTIHPPRRPTTRRSAPPAPAPTAVKVLPPPPALKKAPKVAELPTFESIEQQVQAQ